MVAVNTIIHSTEIVKLKYNGYFYQNYFHFFLLFLLIGICYSNSLQNEWHFDDYPNIIENTNIHIKSISLGDISDRFFSGEGNRKIDRPVAFLSFALNYYFTGLDTTGYHLVNIGIHIVCAAFVYLVFVRTLLLFSDELKEGRQFFLSPRDIALLGTALWALHPIQTQAVTYIVQRMASLAAMFYMIALYSYLCFRTSKGNGRWFFLLSALLFWLLGVGTKENAILLPLSLLVYEVAFFKLPIRNAVKYALFAGVIVALGSVLVASGLGKGLLEIILDPYGGRPFSLGQRLLTEPYVLSRYLFLIFFPTSHLLTPGSDMFLSKGLFDPPSTIMALVFISLLVVAGVMYLKKFPVLCYAILFYFINHLVESSFIGLELYFEHRNYLPSVFIYLAIAYALTNAIVHYRRQAKTFMAGLLSIALTVVLVSEGNSTYLRNDIWKDEVRLWSDAARKYPISLRSYGILSAENIKKQKYDVALDYFYQAEGLVAEHPDRYQKDWIASLYVNAGNAFAAKSKNNDDESARAVELFQKSLEFEPDNWQAHVNLGVLFFRKGDLESARKSLEKVLMVKGDDGSIYNLYGRILYAEGNLDRAVGVFSTGMGIAKTSNLRLNLVAAYMKKGEMQLARRELLKMVPDPKNMAYLLSRALLYPGSERKQVCAGIASQLYKNNVDICDWFEKIQQNSSPNVIYPDIYLLREEIIQAYQEIIDKTLAETDAAMYNTRKITLQE